MPLLIHYYNEWILVCYSDCLATASWVSTIPSSWPRRRLPTATTPSPTTWRRTSASPRAPTSSRVSNSGIRYVAQYPNPTEWSNWILLRKLTFFTCCLMDLFLFLVHYDTSQTTYRILLFPVSNAVGPSCNLRRKCGKPRLHKGMGTYG